MTITQALDHFLANRKLAENTRESYSFAIKKLVQWLGSDLEIDKLTEERLASYVGSLSERKLGTIAHRVRLFRVFFGYFFTKGYIGINPAFNIREPVNNPILPHPLSSQEISLVHSHVTDLREYAVFEVLLETGCRASEACALDRSDFDGNTRCLTVARTAARRVLNLSPAASRALAAYLESRSDDHPSLFATERGHARRLTEHQLWYVLDRLGNRAGLPGRVTSQVLRRTLAAGLLIGGSDLVKISSQLGWQKLDSSRDYLARIADAARRGRRLRMTRKYLYRSESTRPSVFISYVREDNSRAERLRISLQSHGIDAWKDSHELLPGEMWDHKIKKALEKADFAIVCLSKKAIAKRGYFQVEVREILKWQEYQPSGQVYLIPARLEKCEPPDEFSRWQWVDLYEGWSNGVALIAASISKYWCGRKTVQAQNEERKL